MCLIWTQDAISSLQELELLEVVGACDLRIEAGLGRLCSLRDLEFNACE
jgi:hypothetical protein